MILLPEPGCPFCLVISRCNASRASDFDIFDLCPRITVIRGRLPGHRSSSQSSHGVISERRQFSPQEQAAIRFAVNLVQGKWKIGILCRLQEGPARLGDLRRLLPAASKKMLTQHLRQMERHKLIIRADLSGKVSHVEYSLSKPGGVAVSSLLNFLAGWSPREPTWIDDPRGDSVL